MPIDGRHDAERVSLSDQVVLVYRLAAPTVFGGFTIPDDEGEDLGPVSVRIEGSASSSTGPWTLLAESEDAIGSSLISRSDSPAAFVRVVLATQLGSLVFTELIGVGRQDDQVTVDGFEGHWTTRALDGDRRDRPISLQQAGTSISGCVGNVTITGTVDGAVARAIGRSASGQTEVAVVMVLDDEDLLMAITGPTGRLLWQAGAPDTDPAPCAAPPPGPPTCGSTVHIHFPVDSAELRPASLALVDDLFEGLAHAAPQRITIIGYTSTEGTSDYNLSLSEDRALAVVNALVERGIDSQTIDAVGRGERDPIVFPDDDEAARSLNRRVEVGCED